MKLRNKISDKVKNIRIMVDDQEYVFGSVQEIIDWLEKYTEYEVAMPLIKDEKIRKAVRAWAEVNGVDEVAYVSRSNSFGRFGNSIMFDNNSDLHDLEDVRFYTITELCGEEEE